MNKSEKRPNPKENKVNPDAERDFEKIFRDQEEICVYQGEVRLR